MRILLVTLAVLLLAGVVAAGPASAALTFGAMGDQRPAVTPSLLGSAGFPDPAAPPFVTAQANPAVTRGELFPLAACSARIVALGPLEAALTGGRPSPGTPLVIGPVLTPENAGDCQSPGGTLFSVYPTLTSLRLAAAGPLALNQEQ